MGSFSIWHWLIVLAVVLVLFARPGKLSGIFGDLGKGIKMFKKGLSESESGGETTDAEPPKNIESDVKASVGDASKKDETTAQS